MHFPSLSTSERKPLPQRQRKPPTWLTQKELLSIALQLSASVPHSFTSERSAEVIDNICVWNSQFHDQLAFLTPSNNFVSIPMHLLGSIISKASDSHSQ